MSVASFSSGYAEARAKFREVCAEAGGTLEEIRHPEAGPDGKPLYVDVSSFGDAAAERYLVLISGTHGVEGFCGSGAQIDFVRRGEISRIPSNAGILMIHAINPFGFAWLRRTTHENIDLNRNWIDFATPLPDNPGYRELHGELCPQQWGEVTEAAGADRLRRFAEAHGATAAKNALGAGQYEFADGLYYGGQASSWSRLVQTRILEHYLARCSNVAIIDYHTGLGPCGFGEQILTVPASDPAFERASRWYGAAVRSTADGDSAGARIAGDGLSGAAALLPRAAVTGMALEFGTRSREFVIRANRADNWLHTHGDPLGETAREIKRTLRSAYFCDEDGWKGMVLGQSLLACRQALAGLRDTVSDDRTRREVQHEDSA